MTLLEVVDQLHGLAVGGEFNGKKMSKKELKDLLANAMSNFDKDCKILMTIHLRDGTWYCSVRRWLPAGTRFFEFDYLIPDTREQEERLLKGCFDFITF